VAAERVADKGVSSMSNRNRFILAFGLLALGAASAQAQDDRYRKTNDDRYGDERYGDDDRLYKDGAYGDDDYYGDDQYYGDEGYRGQGKAKGRAMNARLQAMDSNRDGRIARSEWQGNAQAFSRRDRNGDGVLAGRELRAKNARRKNRNRNADDTRVDSLRY
jgi:hypothetical protein